MEYIPTIGLEIHCELKTASKMFCACPNNPEVKDANSNVCPICLGHPGTLPVANTDAIKKVRMVGLALHSQILENSKFDRKNYFYPDLPKGYQISQYDQPLCLGGYLEIGGKGPDDPKKTIRITRVHMEEDTGKLMHPEGADHSLVDFNRGGVPLMELVTEPDISNAREAREFVEELQLILRYLGASDADMEKGKMRVEVNISLSGKDNGGKLGTKVEIKNLNSLKSVEGSVAYETVRQKELLESGEKIMQETRGWNDVKQITFSQREKEEAFDYRYFPEPDLPVMTINAKEIQDLKAHICELPHAKRERFKREYGLDPVMAEIFIVNRTLGNYFEDAVSELENWLEDEDMKNDTPEAQKLELAKLCANYLTTDVRGLLKGAEFSRDVFKADPENFAEFIGLIYKKEISSKIAKQVLAEMAISGTDPTEIISTKGLAQISDEGQLGEIISQVMERNQKAVADYRNGKETAFQFLVGQVLGQTRGTANPDVVRKLLLLKLAEGK